MISKTFGRLTVISEADSNKYVDGKGTKRTQRKMRCKCECGNVREYLLENLKRGTTKSCGCLNKEILVDKATKHGYSRTRLYRILVGMKDRCHNEKSNDWKWYGGKGVSVCGAWLDSFIEFREWALSSGYSEELTIDRIDSDKGYSPDNCQWITMSENIGKSNKDRHKSK